MIGKHLVGFVGETQELSWDALRASIFEVSRAFFWRGTHQEIRGCASRARFPLIFPLRRRIPLGQSSLPVLFGNPFLTFFVDGDNLQFPGVFQVGLEE